MLIQRIITMLKGKVLIEVTLATFMVIDLLKLLSASSKFLSISVLTIVTNRLGGLGLKVYASILASYCLYIVYCSLFVQKKIPIDNSAVILPNEERVLRLYGNYSSTTWSRTSTSSALASPSHTFTNIAIYYAVLHALLHLV